MLKISWEIIKSLFSSHFGVFIKFQRRSLCFPRLFGKQALPLRSLVVLVYCLNELRYSYGYHGGLFEGSHWVTWCFWGSWDNGDYSNEKHWTNMTITCGIYIFSKISWLVGVYVWLRNPLHCSTKKWNICKTEKAINLSLIFSIMVTNTGYTSNAPG